MTNSREQAAREYSDKYNDMRFDFDSASEEEILERSKRVSCDGCAQNKTALFWAFLAGCEHEAKRVAARVETYFIACGYTDIKPQEILGLILHPPKEESE